MPFVSKQQRREYQREWRKANPHYMRKYQLKRYHEDRARVIAYLGGSCAKCGATASLEIDHVNGDGHLDRQGKARSPSLRRVETAPSGYFQLLCSKHHREKTQNT